MGKLRAAILLSFRSKLLSPVLGIMLALVAAVTWLVTKRVTAQVEADATRTLATAEAVFKNSQQIRKNNLLVRFHGWRPHPQYRAAFQTLLLLDGPVEDVPADLERSAHRRGESALFRPCQTFLQRIVAPRDGALQDSH